MKAVYETYPDDEIKLFYGLSILGTIKEGTPGFERQTVAAKPSEEVRICFMRTGAQSNR